MKRPADVECVRAPVASPAIRAHAPLLRALADEARLEIVGRLAAAGGPVCVCDLIPGLGLAQPTVSHHLKVLREAGIVRSERRGTWVHYALETSVIGALGSLIAALAPPRAAGVACDTGCAPTKKAS
jgi:ArsR family transcriptional regulator, arsenate/arsenite/antimonite-responsive transcriptional repressor